MRIWKNRWFARFADDENISDDDLCAAIARARRGLIDADLGGGVIKQRVARPGRGRSGGFRTIILFRRGERAFFVYGFAKSKRDNLTEYELGEYKEIARLFLEFTDEEIQKSIKEGKLTEVFCDEKEV